MKTITRAGLISAVFLVGCATGGAASQFAAPPASAQMAPATEGAAAARQWTYKCFKDDNPSSIEQRANQMGHYGFELGASALAGGHDMSSPIWCFKRPL
jgi:hypothetical protein